MTFIIQGIGAAKGISIGMVHIIDSGQVDIDEYTIPETRVDDEIQRLDEALSLARAQLRAIRAKTPSNFGADVTNFINVHLLMLEDTVLTQVPMDLIRERHCNAEWALKIQRDTVVGVFEAMDDPYLRTRKDDVDNVVNRVQWILQHVERSDQATAERHLEGKIVFADDLTPADAVLMRHQGVTGFLTAHGGPNSHAAILARSLRIPVVAGLHNARLYLRDGEEVIIDGRQGALLLEPTGEILAHYQQLQRFIAHHHNTRQRLRTLPTTSANGERIILQGNIELPADATAATEVHADGVGLYRTEFLFMNRDTPPDEEEQYATYRNVLEAMKGAPVTIRTLDLGADKQVDGGRPGAPLSANPALGLRAIRLCLQEVEIFRPQLRAILRAAVHGPVRIMLPMLSAMHEFHQVQEILGSCRQELEREGIAIGKDIPIGGMIEVPAAAVCADLFARELDFLSIGTNDLIQYTIAIDRVDDEVNYLYDPLHPAVLRLIQTTIRAGQRAGIPVAMCGEMAGDARYTRLLLGLGLKEFSVHPNALLEIKQVISESHIGKLKKFAARMMRTINTDNRMALLQAINANTSAALSS